MSKEKENATGGFCALQNEGVGACGCEAGTFCHRSELPTNKPVGSKEQFLEIRERDTIREDSPRSIPFYGLKESDFKWAENATLLPEENRKRLFIADEAGQWKRVITIPTDEYVELIRKANELREHYATMHLHFDEMRDEIDIPSEARDYFSWVADILRAYVEKSALLETLKILIEKGAR